MPVLRKREEVRSTPQMGPVRNFASGFEGALAQDADMMAAKARMYGQAMAAAAEQEAIALSLAAVFTEDENGMPQLPPDPTARMGTIAQRVYSDRTQENYLNMAGNAITAELEAAHAANQHDMDAYMLDARERLERLRQGMPEGLHGAFQSMATGMLVRHGATIGHRMGAQNIDDQRSLWPATHDRAMDGIQAAILSGNPDAAAMLEYHLEELRRIPSHILDEGQRIGMMREARGRAGISRMMVEMGVGPDATTAQLIELQDRLRRGDPGEAAAGFFMWPGTDMPDTTLLEAGANYLTTLLAGANVRQTEVRAQRDRAANLQDLGSGFAPQNQQNAALQDEVMAEGMNLTDANGRRRAITPGDWLTMSERDRTAMVGRIKDTGVMPQSLLNLATRFENGTLSADELVQFATVFRDLRDMNSSANEARDMTGRLPPRVQAIMTRAATLAGPGNAGSETMHDAIQRAIALHDQDWGPQQEVALARSMAGTGGVRMPDVGVGSIFSGLVTSIGSRMRPAQAINEGNAVAEVRRNVIPAVFAGITGATEAEKDEAMEVFLSYVRTGESPQQAMEWARQAMTDRYTESRYTAGSGRVSTGVAPETNYANPTTTSTLEVFARGIAGAEAAMRRGAERLLDGVLGRGSLGSDRFQVFATPRDAFFDAAIRDLVHDRFPLDGVSELLDGALSDEDMERLLTGEMLSDEAADLIGDRLPPAMVEEIRRGGALSREAEQILQRQRAFMPGRDYRLIPMPGGGRHPTYRVELVRDSQAGQVLGQINIGDRWDEWIGRRTRVEQFMQSSLAGLSQDDRADFLRVLESGNMREVDRMIDFAFEQRRDGQ